MGRKTDAGKATLLQKDTQALRMRVTEEVTLPVGTPIRFLATWEVDKGLRVYAFEAYIKGEWLRFESNACTKF